MSQFPPSQFSHASIEYSIPRQSQRPGIITAIGVMSIVVGSLTLLGSLILGGYSSLLFGVARATASARASLPAPMPPPTVATTGASTMPAQYGMIILPDKPGVSIEESKTIADGVHQLHRLSKERREQFEKFLQEAGAVSGFGADEDGKLPDVKKTVLEDRTMPPVTPTALPTDVFVTPNGRIEIYDEGVAFMPGDRSPAMRTTVGMTGVTPIGAGANPAASGGLTTAEAQAVITSIQASGNNLLNPAQVTTITAALQKPGQTLVTPGTASNTFAFGYANGSGSTIVVLNGGQIEVDATGKEVSRKASGAFASPMLSMKVNMTAFATAILECVLSSALGIYLIISGIFVLRHSLLGAKLHWIFVCLKIPLAIAGAIAVPWLWYEFFNSFGAGMPGGSGSSNPTGWIVFGSVLGAFALAYPIGLIFALSSRGVRGYYNSVAGSV